MAVETDTAMPITPVIASAFIGAALAALTAQPHPHPPADHHDPILVGTETALAVATMLVAARILLRKTAD
jgi:hypothetical protein